MPSSHVISIFHDVKKTRAGARAHSHTHTHNRYDGFQNFRYHPNSRACVLFRNFPNDVMHIGYDGCACAFMDSCGLFQAVFPHAVGAFICTIEVQELILEADLCCCAHKASWLHQHHLWSADLFTRQTTDRSVFGAAAQEEETPEPWSGLFSSGDRDSRLGSLLP